MWRYPMAKPELWLGPGVSPFPILDPNLKPPSSTYPTYPLCHNAKCCVSDHAHEGSYCDHLAMQKSARFTGTDCIPWNSLLNFIENQQCCLMMLWDTFRVLTCFINFGRAANMKVNLVVYVHYILQLQDEKNIWNNQQKWLLWIVNQLNVGQPQLGYLRISPRLNPTNELIGRLIAIGFVMAVEIVLIC
jgi:hypothetical protein